MKYFKTLYDSKCQTNQQHFQNFQPFQRQLLPNRLAACDEGKSTAAEEDVRFRKEEAALFANMSSPPLLLTDVSELVDGQEEAIDEKTGDATRREPKRPRKALVMDTVPE